MCRKGTTRRVVADIITDEFLLVHIISGRFAPSTSPSLALASDSAVKTFLGKEAGYYRHNEYPIVALFGLMESRVKALVWKYGQWCCGAELRFSTFIFGP